MRPVERGRKPIAGDFGKYQDARKYLLSRLGPYCNYCERKIPSSIAVEHLKHKNMYPRLELEWRNFLLSCPNCNSSKGTTNIRFSDYYFPDRDNTAAPFVYTDDGQIRPSDHLDQNERHIAEDTLSLTGLDRSTRNETGPNEQLESYTRVSQRMEVRGIAEESRNRLQQRPIEDLRVQIVETALGQGFFSIWMDVFEDHPDMRQRLIEAFPGTAQNCYDVSTAPVSPRPLDNIDHLDHAGKI